MAKTRPIQDQQGRDVHALRGVPWILMDSNALYHTALGSSRPLLCTAGQQDAVQSMAQPRDMFVPSLGYASGQPVLKSIIDNKVNKILHLYGTLWSLTPSCREIWGGDMRSRNLGVMVGGSAIQNAYQAWCGHRPIRTATGWCKIWV